MLLDDGLFCCSEGAIILEVELFLPLWLVLLLLSISALSSPGCL